MSVTGLAPVTTYYYRAFVVVGGVYSYGEVYFFTTPSGEGVTSGDAIDLGLPSGVLWASCNVGATKPEESGGYYAWGEVETKSHYDWFTYAYYDITDDNCNSIGKEISGTEYDVARAKLGENWRMPTRDEQIELVDNCSCTPTTLNGVVGVKLVSNINGNSIFLPASGYSFGEKVYRAGNYGYYWASSSNDSQDRISYMFIHNDTAGYSLSVYSCNGNSVRPVQSELLHSVK